MSLSPLSKVRNLYIFSCHKYYTPEKKVERESYPIIHYPRETKSEDERLIGLSVALCGCVEKYAFSGLEQKKQSSHLSDSNTFESPTFNSNTIDSKSSTTATNSKSRTSESQTQSQTELSTSGTQTQLHSESPTFPSILSQSSQSPQFHDAMQSFSRLEKQQEKSAWIQTEARENVTDYMKSEHKIGEEWSIGKAHTLTNKKTQWVFLPFDYVRYASIEEAEKIESDIRKDEALDNTLAHEHNFDRSTHENLPKENDSPEQNESKRKIILKTKVIVSFVLKRENDENFKSEFSHLIIDFWRTFSIFHSHEFDKFSFKKQFKVVSEFLKVFFKYKSNPLLNQGISFLPVESYPFLKIQAFIHRVVEDFSHVLYPQAIFLYQKYLLFSSMDHHEARVVANHVSRHHNSQVTKPHNHFLFRTGPLAVELPTIDMDPVSKKLPKVSISSVQTTCVSPSNPPNQFQHLLVVDYNNIQIHLFMKEDCHDLETFLALQSQMYPYMDELNQMFGEKIKAIDKFDECNKYLYFNHMNLATMTSFQQKAHAPQLPLYSYHIQQLRNRFLSNTNQGLREIFFKPRKDLWIYGKFFVQREYYIIFDQKIVSLTEFAEEISKFEKIFFYSPTATSKEI